MKSWFQERKQPIASPFIRETPRDVQVPLGSEKLATQSYFLCIFYARIMTCLGSFEPAVRLVELSIAWVGNRSYVYSSPVLLAALALRGSGSSTGHQSSPHEGRCQNSAFLGLRHCTAERKPPPRFAPGRHPYEKVIQCYILIWWACEASWLQITGCEILDCNETAITYDHRTDQIAGKF